MDLQQVLKKQKKIKELEYCSHPEASSTNCSKKIINSHSIQKNGSLSEISSSGHIKHFSADLIKGLKGNLISIDSIGIGKASTFKGFCSSHDSSTFKLIETFPLEINQNTAFLFAYRAVCERLHTKIQEKNRFPLLKEELESQKKELESDLAKGLLPVNKYELEEIFNKKFEKVDKYERSIDVGLSELIDYKSRYDDILLNSDFSNVKFYALIFDRIPEIMCSVALYPECDFLGNQLQDLSDPRIKVDLLTLTISATDSGGIAIFSWLEDSSVNNQFIDSLKSIRKDDLASALIDFSFEFSENIFFSEQWWEGLSEEEKKNIESRVKSGTSLDNYRETICLTERHSKIDWNIIEEKTNLS